MSRKIVVALLTDKQGFQRRQAEDARSAAILASHEVEVLFAGSSSSNQLQQLMGCIGAPTEQRPAGLVVEAVSAGAFEAVARAAAQAGIGWVLLSSEAPCVSYLKAEYPKVPISSVAVDNKEIGPIEAQQCRALLPKGGQIVSLEGPGVSAVTIDRRGGLNQGLLGSNVKIGKTIVADWTEPEAERVFTNWLRLKSAFRPDLVVAQNDAMALGAHRALLAVRKEWAGVPLIGVDGLPEEGQKLVKDGILLATIVTPLTAGKAVEVLARGLGGEPLPSALVMPVHSFPPIEELARRRA